MRSMYGAHPDKWKHRAPTSLEHTRHEAAFRQNTRGRTMERVSTTGLPPASRTAAWNDLYSARMSRVEFIPGDQHSFGAELSIGRFGPVKLARLYVDRCSIERSHIHLAQSPRLYSFLLQASGSSLFQHYGHEVRLAEGDFVLCDTGLPHHFETSDPSVTVMVRD